jgi:hypothetical protein
VVPVANLILFLINQLLGLSHLYPRITNFLFGNTLWQGSISIGNPGVDLNWGGGRIQGAIVEESSHFRMVQSFAVLGLENRLDVAQFILEGFLGEVILQTAALENLAPH